MPISKPPSIPLHRVATATPFIDFLHHKGAKVERELKRAGLPILAMDDPDCFIPSRQYWDFIANITERAGIRNLGFQVGLQSGANAADPGLAKRLRRLPSLHQALEQFCKTVNTGISRVSIRLEPGINGSHHLHYQTSYDCEHPAYVHFQWYGLIAILNTVRLFTGKHWQPREIGLATGTMPAKAIRDCFSNTRFTTGQADCFITISNRLLGKQPRPEEEPAPAGARYTRMKPPGDFIGSLKLVLRSYLADGAPSAELAADIAGLSTRTLQRRLADEGFTYRELLDDVRFGKAVDLMQDADNSITHIASQLGYTDPSHFARAFRRLAGMSPREYMQQS